MRTVIALLALFASLALPGTATADTLLIDNARQGQAQNLPPRGMLKSRVEQLYGAPRERLPAVGQPPISRWVYDGYTVYFEHEHVIHAVQHHRKP